MPEYRRLWVAGGTYFLTLVTCGRRSLLHGEAVAWWREALAAAAQEKPFHVQAGVVLPDHVHLIVQLPTGDADISSRIGRAKALFSRAMREAGRAAGPARRSQERRRESGIWQRRFYDHPCRDDRDHAIHMDYLHYNPVKHGYVRCPADWPHSSFNHWVRNGLYPEGWGCGAKARVPDFADIATRVGE
ncbi:MAG: transposase [Phycisphaeraceae bacterium]